MRKKKKGSVSVSKQAEGSGKNFKELLKMYEAKHTNSLWAQHAAEKNFCEGQAYSEDLFAKQGRSGQLAQGNGSTFDDLFAKQDAQVREANKYLEEGNYGSVLYGPEYPVEYKKQQAFFAKKAASAPRLPTDSTERKNIPLASGVLDYFPDALAAVAAVSKAGNDQHNPGEPLHWARGKSMDQGDTLIRHFLERGSVDVDGLRHSAKMAWRALALLQLEIEQEKGLPPSRGSK